MTSADNAREIATEILGLERAALNRWGRGDPGGYLDITAPDATYFDPFQEQRLDGRAALAALYEQFRGKIKIESDDIIHPCIQVVGDAAILTFNYVSKGSEGSMHWNCTEVYQRFSESWKIIHTHWSFTKMPA
jgi:ketosteroid isomerase-like protein